MDLIHHRDAVAVESDDFLRVIGKQPNFPDSKRPENLSSNAVNAQIYARVRVSPHLSRTGVGIMIGISLYLINKVSALVLLPEVNQDTPAGILYRP